MRSDTWDIGPALLVLRRQYPAKNTLYVAYFRVAGYGVDCDLVVL
jgi:hypothetical protein